MTKKIDHSKRTFMKSSTAVAGALAMPMILTSNKARAAPVEINMLAWYGHGESDVVGAYEEANNVKFNKKYYSGGDNMLALISQSPPGTYDLILSDAEFVMQLNEAGYIEELDAADYNFDDMLHEDFKKFPGHWKDDKLFSVMVRFGHLGVSYNTKAMSAEDAMSYKSFWKPELKGKVGHFDWHLPNLGMLSLHDGNGANLWDLDEAAWKQVQETAMSLRPQVGGFFDYGGTFNSLKNGEMQAMCGIGDWITGALERDGASVASVIPKEGGIQFTESYSIGKGSEKAAEVKKFIQHMLTPEGQLRSTEMAAYPAFCVTKGGRALLNEKNPKEAKRSGQIVGEPNEPIHLINEGRIHYRDVPVQQSLEDWNDFWSDYKNA